MTCQAKKVKKSIFTVLFFLSLWFCAAAQNNSLTASFGHLKLVLHRDTGSFSLYYLSDRKNQKYTPLLIDKNNSATTTFALQIDDTIYDLKPGSRVSVTLAELPTGARIAYTVKNHAEVTIDFTLFASVEGRSEDAVKIEIGIKNTEETAHQYAIKGVFDTWLGESAQKHFSTLLKPLIKSETVFTTMDADKWIVSSDDRLSVLFLLSGANVTAPRQVTLAARDVLLDNPWVSRTSIGRSFSTAAVLNNSAMQILWRQIRLNPATSAQIRFFITAASDGYKPAFSLKEAESADVAAKTGFYIDSTGTAVSIAAITEKQLDPSYVAELIKRIENLEKNPTNIDPDELKHLNTELDAILERLNRR